MAIIKKRVVKPLQTSATQAPSGSTQDITDDNRISAPLPSGFSKAREMNASRDEERERAKEIPFDLHMKPGENKKVLLTDNKEPFFTYEHKYKNPQGRWVTAPCIQDKGPCPLCADDRFGKGYFVMKLSCVDFTPFTNKKGETIKMSRKILNVKQSKIPVYERILSKHGTVYKENGQDRAHMRGIVLSLYRDGDKDPGSGSAIEFEKKIGEEEIVKKIPADVLRAVDFHKAFPRMSAEEIRKKYLGGSSSVVGQEDLDESWGGTTDDPKAYDGMGDSIPF